MKKLIVLAALAAIATSCKTVTVSTADWSASYTSFMQENDVKGLKVTAGDNVALELEQTRSNLDPAAQDALRTAAAALAAASRACAACATGGVSDIPAAVTGANSTSCPSGTCSDSN